MITINLAVELLFSQQMRKTKKYSFWIALALINFLLTACQSTRYFSIDVMEPAELYLPENFDTLLVTHNAFPDTNKPSGIPFVIYGELLRDTIFRDSALALNAVQTLDGMLSQIGRFEAIVVDSLGRGLPDEADKFTIDHVDSMKVWCRKYNADGFLILTSLEKKIEYDIYYEMFGSSFGEFTALISSKWLLINPFNSKLIDAKTIRDTLYLPVNNPNSRSDEDNYRNSIQLLEDASEYAGIQYGSYLSPHYAETNRMIFMKGSGDIKKGYSLAEQGDWKAAAVYWREALSEPNNKIRAKASFNLALASEMEGLLEPALGWAEKSYQFFPDTINTTYIEILKERIKNQEQIILQMEGK